jgi:hypothetical protein
VVGHRGGLALVFGETRGAGAVGAIMEVLPLPLLEAVGPLVDGFRVDRPHVGMVRVPDHVRLPLVRIGLVEPPVRAPANILDVGAVLRVLVLLPLEHGIV